MEPKEIIKAQAKSLYHPNYRRSDVGLHKQVDHSKLPAGAHGVISHWHAKKAAAHLHKGDQAGFDRHMEVAHYHMKHAMSKKASGDTSLKSDHADWWDKLSKQGQMRYIKQHPNSAQAHAGA